jgi:hypothetical protein
VTALRFPAEIAVGEVSCEDAREPGGWLHLLAIGEVDVPDGTSVTLKVYTVAEVTVSDQQAGIWEVPAGTGKIPAFPRRRRRPRERVTWRRGMPDSALRNNRSIWGGPEVQSFSITSGDEPVDLEFVRRLPAGSVDDLTLGAVVPSTFAAVAHLAPGLRRFCAYVDDNLGDETASVIAGLTALESLALAGNSAIEDGPGLLNDDALSAIADLPALEYLALMGGSYTEHGLQRLRRLPKLQHLHIERYDLTASMFEFAATMPALTRLSGLDEFGDDGPMPPAEVDQVRAMLPHITVG